MPVRSETTEIDGLKISTTQFGAIRQSKLLARLGRAIGPLASILIPAMSGKPEDALKAVMEIDLGTAISAVFARLDGDETEGLLKDILGQTSVIVDDKNIALDGTANIDRAFSGRLLTLFKVVGFVLKVNFMDFSEAARSLARGVEAKATE